MKISNQEIFCHFKEQFRHFKRRSCTILLPQETFMYNFVLSRDVHVQFRHFKRRSCTILPSQETFMYNFVLSRDVHVLVQVLLHDGLLHHREHQHDVLRVGGASEVRVDVFRRGESPVFPLLRLPHVQVHGADELPPRLRVVVGPCERNIFI